MGLLKVSFVHISGVWHIADIELQARDALRTQHDIFNVEIVSLTLVCAK